jgi:lipopolysaccharide/colanic/teichoic acid biosynthesis glycosyltransferase
MKRLFDIFFSTTFLILFSPLFLILSILIYFQDKGPVFFIQNRVGYQGKIFKLIKFRTMSVSKMGHHFIELGDKSRVTSIGRILRKSKLDELPQLINVLKGEMSIVGPRPEVPQFMNNYQDKWIIVQRLKPGLTDHASIEFRNEEEILTKAENPNQTYIKEILPKKLEYYQQYEKDHTMWEDLKIIFKTIYVVIFK